MIGAFQKDFNQVSAGGFAQGQEGFQAGTPTLIKGAEQQLCVGGNGGNHAGC